MVQCCEPTHFVCELVTVRRLAIWKVAANDTHIAEGGCDHARHVVFKSRDVFDDLRAFAARNEGHTVVGFLSKPLSVVTRLSESCKRELVIAHFEFLQSKHIDGVFGTECLLSL